MGKKKEEPKGSVIRRSQKSKKQQSVIVNLLFWGIVILFVVGAAKGLNKPDPEIHRIPPSVPTDVGTLPPGLDK